MGARSGGGGGAAGGGGGSQRDGMSKEQFASVMGIAKQHAAVETIRKKYHKAIGAWASAEGKAATAKAGAKVTALEGKLTAA